MSDFGCLNNIFSFHHSLLFILVFYFYISFHNFHRGSSHLTYNFFDREMAPKRKATKSPEEESPVKKLSTAEEKLKAKAWYDAQMKAKESSISSPPKKAVKGKVAKKVTTPLLESPPKKPSTEAKLKKAAPQKAATRPTKGAKKVVVEVVDEDDEEKVASFLAQKKAAADWHKVNMKRAESPITQQRVSIPEPSPSPVKPVKAMVTAVKSVVTAMKTIKAFKAGKATKAAPQPKVEVAAVPSVWTVMAPLHASYFAAFFTLLETVVIVLGSACILSYFFFPDQVTSLSTTVQNSMIAVLVIYLVFCILGLVLFPFVASTQMLGGLLGFKESGMTSVRVVVLALVVAAVVVYFTDNTGSVTQFFAANK